MIRAWDVPRAGISEDRGHIFRHLYNRNLRPFGRPSLNRDSDYKKIDPRAIEKGRGSTEDGGEEDQGQVRYKPQLAYVTQPTPTFAKGC